MLNYLGLATCKWYFYNMDKGPGMDQSVHNKLVSFIWNIADDCLRDVYVRGKYRDVILPMVVLRRLDSLLEPTKDAVLAETEFQKNEMKLTELDDEGLRAASGYVFYNTSKWTLTKLASAATNNRQILLANIDEYLQGFSSNVKEIIECFELKSKISHMAQKDVLLDVINKFLSPDINLSPNAKQDSHGYALPALTNLGMGYVFEELIRKFNEENNEEAGEHFTPREVIELMTHLVFEPIKASIPDVMTVYDPACGSGGMLTETENFIREHYKENADIYLYGKEVNDETYAICKSDMMIKGNNPENIRLGSTLSTDEFAGTLFDFMLSNPPYGKSWNSEEKYIKDGKDIIDARFVVSLNDYWGKQTDVVDATPRTSDGQLLFLMEMVSKMKPTTNGGNGSRIASVHNGSSLFTGDAGSGESNIRRYIIENDMLDAIIQLPNNLFYNTGITTYIWLLSNHKPAERKGKVQLIDASLLFRKLRKNLGDKNCEFSPEDIALILKTYLDHQNIERSVNEDNEPSGIASQVFNNSDFGYYKVNIERPDRRTACFSSGAIEPLRFDKRFGDAMSYFYHLHGDDVYQKDFLKNHENELMTWCEEHDINLSAKDRKNLLNTDYWHKLKDVCDAAFQLMHHIGTDEFKDFNHFKVLVDDAIKALKLKLSASEKNSILNSVSWYDETAEKVISKVVKLKDEKLQELLDRYQCDENQLSDFGYYRTHKQGEYMTYVGNSDLRDAESIPLNEKIHDYFVAEVKPHVQEAWINLESVKIGYEISFNKYFYRHKPLRSLEAVAADILALEKEADGLIAKILGVN